MKLLLQSGCYRGVIALVRRSVDYQHPLFTEKVINFEDLDSALAGLEADDIFCCLGSTIKQAGSRSAFRDIDLGIPQQIAQKMVGHASHFLLVSALAANSASPVFYSRVKGELEDSVRALNYPYVTIVRPSLLAGKREHARAMETLGVKLISALQPVLRGPLQNYAVVSAEDVAFVLLKQAQLVGRAMRKQQCQIIESAGIQGAAEI